MTYAAQSLSTPAHGSLVARRRAGGVVIAAACVSRLGRRGARVRRHAMDNKVGDTIPSEREAAKLAAQLDALEKAIADFSVTLSAEERRRQLRFRPGGERAVQLVARLAQKYKLALRGAPIEGMLAD